MGNIRQAAHTAAGSRFSKKSYGDVPISQLFSKTMNGVAEQPQPFSLFEATEEHNLLRGRAAAVVNRGEA